MGAADFAAIANVVIAFLALIVAALSIVLTFVSIRSQSRHNRLSLKPVPQITALDLEDRLCVSIENLGPGPLFIKSLSVSNTTVCRDDISSFIPTAPGGLAWNRLVSDARGRVIRSGDELLLFKMQGDPANAEYRSFRDECRIVLSDLSISLKYTDVYGSSFRKHSDSLGLFGKVKRPT